MARSKPKRRTNSSPNAGKGTRGARRSRASPRKGKANKSKAKPRARKPGPSRAIVHKKRTLGTSPVKSTPLFLRDSSEDRDPEDPDTEDEPDDGEEDDPLSEDDEDEDEDEDEDDEDEDLDINLDEDEDSDDDVGADHTANLSTLEDPFVRKRRALTPKFSVSDGLAIPRRVKKIVIPGTPTRSVTSTPTPRSSRQFTPYVDRPNPREPSKPLLSHQSPPTQALIKKAALGYRADTIARKAFLDSDQRPAMATQFFYQAAKDLNAPRRALRFEHDVKYQENVLKMIMRCDSQVRGEVMMAARAAVPAAYNLGTGRGSPDVNKLFVALLLTKNNFVFRDIEVQQVNPTTLHVVRRIGPYRKGVIAALIESELFHSHEQMAAADATKDLFNPMPIAVIAFIATAVQCALCDWTTGIRIKTATEFSSDQWAVVYDKHVATLEKMRSKKKKVFVAWTRLLYKDCWSTTRQYLAAAPGNDSFIEDDEMGDYDDIEGIADEVAAMDEDEE